MMERRKRRSLATVSAELGVSKTTVSAVLNGRARAAGISAALEGRVRAFCDKVNYLPNIHARRMNSTQVGNVGVMLEAVSDIDAVTPLGEYSVSRFLGGIAAGADAAGCRFTVQLYRPEMRDSRVFDWFRSREIDGLVHYGFEMPPAWRETIVREGFKVVGVSVDPACGLPTVNIDNFEASFKLTEHLVDKGYRSFLYVAGNECCHPAEERFRGFREALRAHSVAFAADACLRAGFDPKVAERLVTERFIAGKLTADAVVCVNDMVAVGVLRALASAGLRVPKDIAVAGADNTQMGEFIAPALTTFDFLAYEQGKAAFGLLHDMVCGRRSGGNVTLKAPLFFRASA